MSIFILIILIKIFKLHKISFIILPTPCNNHHCIFYNKGLKRKKHKNRALQ